jgi:hypothetical protein
MARSSALRRSAERVGLRLACGVLALSSRAFALQTAPSKPVIVKIIPPEQKSELSGLADVLLGSLGLTGVIVLAAVLLGAVMAGVMFWVRSRSA